MSERENKNYQREYAMPIQRASGILLPISSLPSPYGIGSLGKQAFKFVDFLVKSGQSYWQILPLCPTGFMDSPYQELSIYGGNPYFIDLDLLIEQGLLEPLAPYNIDFGNDLLHIDYGKIYVHRDQMLHWAYEAYKYKNDITLKQKIAKFRKDNADWIEDFALYMAIKHSHDGKPWRLWEQSLSHREPSSIAEFRQNNEDGINYQVFVQYLFFEQWYQLKKYANARGIKIIGDMPLYISEDSVELWSQRELFLVDEDGKPQLVAGTPPDYYTTRGQKWGNPLYNWDKIKAEKYAWWVSRFKHYFKLYDFVRLDHFRGFEMQWCVPYEDHDASRGHWQKGPGIELFDELHRQIASLPIIIEDLGVPIAGDMELKSKLDFPGMAVLQFAFDPKMNSIYLPHNVDKNCVYYVGTHDNDTVLGWCKRINNVDLELARRYLGLSDREGYNWGIIRGVMTSSAQLCILLMQDLLGHDNWARINTPGTIDNNWCWRIQESDLDEDLIYRLQFLTKISGRRSSSVME